CMAKLLLSPVEGTITRIDEDGINEIAKERGAEISIDFPVGHKVFAMNDGTDRFGHVIAKTADEAELDSIISEVRACIEIDGKPLEEIWKK
ncbi:MAG: hypothetical protein HUJ79_07240, partial [Firmicutes bacterium]|nr:hypothetical protein [Bacillota bacterium]